VTGYEVGHSHLLYMLGVHKEISLLPIMPSWHDPYNTATVSSAQARSHK